jgi:DNA replication protein DnaC
VGGCGQTVSVDVSGPEDSLVVRVAKTSLDRPMCDGCEEVERVREETERRVQERAERIAGRVRASGVPSAWSRLTLDELEPCAEQALAVAAARGWARRETRGVVLHGLVGRGKTVIAAAAAVEGCAAGAVRWIGVASLLTDLRMPFDSPKYERALRLLDDSAGAALVLDDLDKLRPTEHSLQPLYVAVNGWIESGLPLLVTLNRDLDSLAEWMGETFGAPIASRLAGYCDVVEVRGEDWRLR